MARKKDFILIAALAGASILFVGLLVFVLLGPKQAKDDRPAPDISTHYDSIGFPAKTISDITSLAAQVKSHGQHVAVASKTGESYYRLVQPEGVELWAAVAQDGSIEGLIPYLRPRHLNAVKLTSSLEDSHWPYQGAFAAQVGGVDADAKKPCGSIVFNSPNYLTHANVQFPRPVLLGLVAFAREVTVFRDVSAFAQGQPLGTPIAVRSFFPSGMYMRGEGVEQKSEVVFSGVVQGAERLVNSSTAKPFYRISVETSCLWIDVVADPQSMPAVPVPGNLLGVGGWLLGDWTE